MNSDTTSTMKIKFGVLLLTCCMGTSVYTQQWLAPGACWKYMDQHVVTRLETHEYVQDTVVDGYDVQEERITERFVYQGQPSSSFLTFKRYIRMEGNAVMYKCGGTFCPPDPVWDTLYYLGVPGDRWSSQLAVPECYPHGVIEITDTGHVVIQGVSLRTWDLTYLDVNGLPVPDAPSTFADSLGIIERIGSPVGNPPQPCGNGAVDYPAMLLLHYSDNDIFIPDGSSCDIATGQLSLREAPGQVLIHPNPGATFQLTGIGHRPALLRLLDMQGRVVREGIAVTAHAPVDMDDLKPGNYLVELRLAEGQREVIRWVRE